MLDGKLVEDGEPEIRPVLVFHRAAYGDVVIAVRPVTGDAFHEPFNSFGQENKIQVPAFPDHVPAFAAPWVRPVSYTHLTLPTIYSV